MSVKFGFRDQVFDDETPLYIDVRQDVVFNRLTRKLLEKTSLLAEMTADGYVLKEGEMGASPGWVATHQGSWSHLSAADIGITVDGVPAEADGGEATIVIETYGGLTAEPITVDASFQVGANPDIEFSVEIPADSSYEDVISELTEATEWAANDQTVATEGDTITVTNGDVDDELADLSVAVR